MQIVGSSSQRRRTAAARRTNNHPGAECGPCRLIAHSTDTKLDSHIDNTNDESSSSVWSISNSATPGEVNKASLDSIVSASSMATTILQRTLVAALWTTLSTTTLCPIQTHAMSSLLVPLSPSSSSSYDTLFFRNDRQSPLTKSGFAASLPSSKAMQQLRQAQDLQNERLLQCEDSAGLDRFEQCFFYGTEAMPTTTQATPSLADAANRKQGEEAAVQRQINPNGRSNKAGIPTW